MEIAGEIQEAIDRDSFLTPEEYELGKMDGYAFCGEEAIELFREFSNKVCEEPPARTGESKPETEVTREPAAEATAGETTEKEPVLEEPAPTEEFSGEPADFYYKEGWKLPEGGSKTRYQCNVAAIHTLRMLEQEGSRLLKGAGDIGRVCRMGGLQTHLMPEMPHGRRNTGN